jgi:asparagine synthase (glutamine-hydrolysing)
MCGLVGIADSRRGEPAIVARMRDTMTHRGPDDEGLWSSPDQTVILGHRRLSIIDLSQNGHQPMVAADGKTCIAFNGEIYNFLDLRAELEGHGYGFVSNTDTEVILHAYRHWGDDCVARLNGMFAFAIYDARRERLLIARDRAGEKPLFYHHGASSFMFASEVKALLANPAVPRRAPVASLNLFFAFGYLPRGTSMLETIQKLPQGHAMSYEVRTNRLTTWPYWSLPEPPADDSMRSEDELCEEAHALLQDAIRRQLVADVPVGILLSGGVDSSLITAVASEVASGRVKTFTISFPGSGVYDEAPHARLVASHFGTEHHELVAEPATVDLLPKLAEQFDEPMADSSMVPTYLVSKLIRQEAKVALGGDGGDELFGGYFQYSRLLQRNRMQRFIPSPLRRAINIVASRAMPAGMPGRRRILGLTSDLPRAIAQMNIFFDVDERKRLLRPVWPSLDGGGSQPEAFKESLCPSWSSPLQQITRVDFMTYLCDDILAKVDRASMLTSLEVRAPFLDHRIIDFAFGRVPDTLRAVNGGRKLLLRALGRKLLPPQLDLKRKQGFSIPFDDWFKGEWGRFIEEILRQADPAIFARASIDRLIRGQRHGASNTPRLFSITMFELWRRHYNISVIA